MKPFDKNIADMLISGGVGVIPTDTIYGLVGRAEMASTVERIYRIRKRNAHKPCIILISSYEDLKKFNIEISSEMRLFLETHRLWPGKVSIVFSSANPRFEYLTRGTNSLAFRMPDIPELRDLLAQTGPLIAPSANREGDPPATTMVSARQYFKDSIDFYVDDGELHSLPSTLIQVSNGKITTLREGARDATIITSNNNSLSRMPKNKIAYWILATLLAGAFGFVGFLKVSANPMEIEIFTRFGYPLWFMYAIGAAELSGAIGLIGGRLIAVHLPRMAAMGLLVIMIGAIGSHLMYDPLFMILPAVTLSVLLLGFLYASRPVVV